MNTERWAEAHERPLRDQIVPHTNERSPDRRLRIGYVSPDFWQHPVGYFIEPVIRGHNRRNVEVFCYSDVVSPDALTERLRPASDHSRDIKGLDHAAVANMIRMDQIDILIDLAGHTARNRLLVFARKPAPVQATYLGYVNTTGLRAMDYIIVGPDLMTEEFPIRVEQLCRLPQSGVCYQPPLNAIEVGELPALASGQITFACMSGVMKISIETWKAWTEILRRVPNSRLMLQARDPAQMQRLIAALDVAPGRIQFIPHQPLAAYFAIHRQFDIVLDPFPHCGGITTCDALWMGIPIITRPGHTPVSRVGLSLLTSVGMRDLAARSREHYVDLAVDLATDLPRLSELRRTLRRRMETSPLMDVPGFVVHLENAYRTMWQTWCAGPCGAGSST